jgi:hypothetical protein
MVLDYFFLKGEAPVNIASIRRDTTCSILHDELFATV